MIELSKATLIEALRNYAGHTSDCTTQRDDECDCGWDWIRTNLPPESEQEERERDARYRAGIELHVPFWCLRITVESGEMPF